MFKLVNKIHNSPDTNGLGSVPYEYFMSEFPVSNSEYCEFLNSFYKKSIFNFSSVRCINQGIYFDNSLTGLKFLVRKGYENRPVVHVSYHDALRYINWINDNSYTDEKVLHTGEINSEYWLPSHNEWYKAAYFDGAGGFYDFPLQTNKVDISANINAYSFNSNYILGSICNNGLFNLNKSTFDIKDMAGNVYEFIRDDHENDFCTILGGSWNRNHMNSHKSNHRFLNKNVYNDYTGFRICKKCPSRLFRIALYNNFGDGWKNDYISVTDSVGGRIIDKASLESGGGPQFFEFRVYSDNILMIEYYSGSGFCYDNFYEIYNGEMKKIYQSKSFNGNNKQVVILNKL